MRCLSLFKAQREIRLIVRMMIGQEKGVKPVLLKFGLALALSFAGFLYSRFRIRRIKPSKSRKRGSFGHESEVNSGGGIGAALSTCNTISARNFLCSEETCTDREITGNSPLALSPDSTQNGDRDEFLLPEFNDLLKVIDFGATVVRNSSKINMEAPWLKEYADPEKDDYEQEVAELRNMIRMLQDREQSLEVQLLEYCGLREQETAVMELQNRLKASTVEVKMFNLKVKTLQSENLRLKEQVSDHGKVLAELESANAQVKLLNEKIKYEVEQNREQIISLQQKVSRLQDQQCKDAACDQDIQIKLQKLKELESEAEELRKSNLRLQIENSHLVRRLDSTQILANAVLEDPEVDAVKQESECLKQENARLTKEIEQLYSDRCSDLEELVYMRWINACLRYELRNYEAPPGKTVAKDLSRSLSPTSERKAKQLILEYANADGPGNIVDFDIDQWSSSQASSLTDIGECDDFSSVDNSSVAKTNTTSQTKLLSKLRQLIQGKDSCHHHSHVSSQEKFRRQNSNPQRQSTSTGIEGLRSEFATPIVTSRTSLDFSRLTCTQEEVNRRNSDSAFMESSKKFSPRKSGSFSDSLGLEKNNLEKYAEALKDSSVSARQQRRSRSASCS
ncbi:protein CHUP1, chloroplastic-like [Vigna umbellata]|uniref:protein CHUP1, chloroplastic-like n=1 Tax=Vigna umbellata TaxID=87088 RepID=UPI001F5E9B1D|nr:protein CHUP1, chloroplastic-like [Vigna umbellata]XP_047160772.1 protein CHUP1, chloroplastic-like [Vigna umbellata]XP_047160773.1 protein CHUP1, chloroplastic-like [Vigna umbellata]